MGIIVVTCYEEVWQHCLETVLLEEEVTVPLSAQEHERQQCSFVISLLKALLI